MVKNPNLPEEILEQIFSRLPARSVGKCRCLSTLWRSRLSDPSFLNLHFTRKSQQQHLLLVTDDDAVRTIDCPITEESVWKNLDGTIEGSMVVGSVDGLVLISVVHEDFILMNPITREQVFIPGPSFNINPKVHGFGYDNISNDYKIVSIGEFPSVSVYSVNRGVWVEKDNFPSDISDDMYWHGGNGAFFNGAIHWIGVDIGDECARIVAFDLHTEEFSLVPTPVFAECGLECTAACVVWGCLCFLQFETMMGILEWGCCVPVVWKNKQYGSEEKWTNIPLCEDMHGDCSLKPLCNIGEDQVVVVDQVAKSLRVYNVVDYTENVITDSDGAFDGCAFVESLVSPRQLRIGGG